MNRTMHIIIAAVLVTAILLITPKLALADGGTGGHVVTANGYQVELIFKEPVTIGENEFHIQITDSMDMPVPNAEVEVSAMPAEGMSAHDENSEMEMATEAPAIGVMKPNEPAGDVHGEESLVIMLEPTMESGEYAGELHFDTSGEWMLNIHFTVNGETTQVDFPVEIARTLGLNYAVLAGFLGINGAVIATAAFLKRKPVVIRQ